jgi:hypothetical protein
VVKRKGRGEAASKVDGGVLENGEAMENYLEPEMSG